MCPEVIGGYVNDGDIPVVKNGNGTDAPDYPRLLRKLKLDQGEIWIIIDAGVVDFEVIQMINMSG